MLGVYTNLYIPGYIERDIFHRLEQLSNGAIPLPNYLYILMCNTNTLPKIVFRNVKNLGFYSTSKYAKIASEIISSTVYKFYCPIFIYIPASSISEHVYIYTKILTYYIIMNSFLVFKLDYASTVYRHFKIISGILHSMNPEMQKYSIYLNIYMYLLTLP